MVENTSKAAEVAYLPAGVPPTNHGHTVAAWVTMAGITLGVIVSAVGLVPTWIPFVFWLGFVVVAVALVVGWVLRQAGLGQKPVRR